MVIPNISINGGTFKNNQATVNGGALYISTDTKTVTINSGEITNNSADLGGGIALEPNVTFVLNGGTINNNSTSSTTNAMDNIQTNYQ